MPNSRQKGKRGELDAADFLRRQGFAECRRGRQYRGSPESPDLLGGPQRWAIEVKLRERLNLYEALDQAEQDAEPGHSPVLMHRKNRKRWLFTMAAEDFENAAKRYLESLGYRVWHRGDE